MLQILIRFDLSSSLFCRNPSEWRKVAACSRFSPLGCLSNGSCRSTASVLLKSNLGHYYPNLRWSRTQRRLPPRGDRRRLLKRRRRRGEQLETFGTVLFEELNTSHGLFRLQKQAKEEERLKKEQEAREEASAARAKQEAADREAAKKREEEKQRREAEKRAKQEELIRKEEEKRKRVAEDREREAEALRKKREREEAAKAEREAKEKEKKVRATCPVV